MEPDVRVFYASGINTTSGFRVAFAPSSTMPSSLRLRAERTAAEGGAGVRRFEVANCPADAADDAVGRAAERALSEGRISLDERHCDFGVIEPFMGAAVRMRMG